MFVKVILTASPNLRLSIGLLSIIVTLGCTGIEGAFADWPEYRGNLQRTSYSGQVIESEIWVPGWRSAALDRPIPAWPAPAKGSLWQKLDSIEARGTDDRSNTPLVVVDRQGKSHVLVTSVGQDRLVCFEPRTGQVEWDFFCKAPIRYAPSVADGNAYFGADDGYVRRINLATGKLSWRVRIGPDLPWIVGNRRFVCPHPIRTGVMVIDNVVYATAGLFPNQGVYLVALDAESGDLIWRRRSTRSPQGYLLSTPDEKIYCPTGRAVPFAIAAPTGKHLADLPSTGGSFCMLTPDAFFAGLGNDATIKISAKENPKLLSFKGRRVAAGNGRIWTCTDSKLICLNARQVMGGEMEPVWQSDLQGCQDLVACGQGDLATLFVAVGNRIEIYDANSGRVKATLTLPEKHEVQTIAVSSKHGDMPELVVASVESGDIYTWFGRRERSEDRWTTTLIDESKPVEINASGERMVVAMKRHLPIEKGMALVVGDESGGIVEAIRTRTGFDCLAVVNDAARAGQLREYFCQQKAYGNRVVVWQESFRQNLPFSDGLFNVVVDLRSETIDLKEAQRILAPEVGMLILGEQEKCWTKKIRKGAGVWRHQYAGLTNQSDSLDQLVGSAAGFRLSWFGSVGPQRMPDRHLRGPAPLVAGGCLVMQGDGVLIGVDPFNGVERWERKLPDQAMRYVTPYDAGYACLTKEGDAFWIAAGKEIWHINSYTGELIRQIPLPAQWSDMKWGYLSEAEGALFASVMKPTAPRTAEDKATRYSYVNSDYKSERPLVASRAFIRLAESGKIDWEYKADGVLVHGAFAVDAARKRAVMLEARSDECQVHERDRIPLGTLLKEAYLVCVDTETGERVWEQKMDWPNAKNVFYTQLTDDRIVLSTSASQDGYAFYSLRVHSTSNGSLIWKADHKHVKSGLFHGEQVHHPVILRQGKKPLLIAEPFLYELTTGKRVVPDGANEDWALVRPGHSCGTLSAAGNCLFFRAGNPTVLNLSESGGEAFTKLAPSRAGCWINMVPAAGRLLIPEGSASCVCNYSLQTSMTFQPLSKQELKSKLPILPDILRKDN